MTSTVCLMTLRGVPNAVEDRVVRRLHPERFAVLALALVLRRLSQTGAQVRPELVIGRRVALIGIQEHAVMLAANLLEPIAGCLQELLVRVEHAPVEIKMDDRRGTPNRVHVPAQIAHAEDERTQRASDPVEWIRRHPSQPPRLPAVVPTVAGRFIARLCGDLMRHRSHLSSGSDKLAEFAGFVRLAAEACYQQPSIAGRLRERCFCGSLSVPSRLPRSSRSLSAARRLRAAQSQVSITIRPSICHNPAQTRK